MLFEIRHRTEQTQKDLQLIRSRDVLVGARTKLIVHVRGTLKAHGQFVQSCSSEVFTRRVRTTVLSELQLLLDPVLQAIERLAEAIKSYDQQIEHLVRSRYGDAERLMQIHGVGALTALTFMLVLEDHRRFRGSRMVGPYLGLTPARDQSGESDPQKGISKQGDQLLRKLLVQSGHYVLGPFGQDSDLRRHGLRIAERGGKNAKKRAAVAVARKLSVLMHHLWATGQTYVPLFNSSVPSAA
jgi:transposase